MLNQPVTDGLNRVAELGLSEYSAEALALRYPFSTLFSREELDQMAARLRCMQSEMESDYELEEASAVHN
jgi:hypothetical protein